MMSLNGTIFERCLTLPYAVGRPYSVFFLMPLKTHSVLAHMLNDSCQVESMTYDLLQQNQGLHHWKDWPYLALSFKLPSWPSDCVWPLWTNPVSNLRKLSFSWIAWIHSEARRFISVRVGEIQTNTEHSQWKHIPGEMNVVDDVSRGIPVRNFVERLQHEPKFLRLPENKWP